MELERIVSVVQWIHFLGSQQKMKIPTFYEWILPDPPDALLLATATMSPTQMRVRPVMTATRRLWTLFMMMPALILTHS